MLGEILFMPKLLATNYTMFWNTITAGAFLAHAASAQNMLRFACSQLTIERGTPD